ncbi:hypothetical protein Cob_v006974 [Colletotrichum orbiculare MAFF 240422]|uniref:Uncharacterized protein n=1 Tax=Colletotrichum orbiculare (strain 104-T / ATCC 96160 / CBS 514.97 / LARS 414 / MAFF 240422) TaxID=1213857 RepID=A0A484FQI3_COLOR|nr:hypothetical protein Cob_v006974 [Colletotrichum orbiculare MAFF 240422]
MPSLEYYSYAGVGKQGRTDIWYSQAVRIGDRIECPDQRVVSFSFPPARSSYRIRFYYDRRYMCVCSLGINNNDNIR